MLSAPGSTATASRYSANNTTTTLFARNDRHIAIAHYNQDSDRLFGYDFSMPPTGPWVLLSATISSGPIYNEAAWPSVATKMAADLLYNPTWAASRNKTYSLVLANYPGDDAIYPDHLGHSDRPEVDPYWLYRPRSATLCQRCTRSPTADDPSLRRCTARLSASYCSKKCQEDDWAVHKAACKRLRRS
ncbi:hypothetical protein FH972_027144 [Carpinus fangiana]|uniref:MYND-type domain-containing protein n=1 Tax=Carpinus fangiana TaxID=176857 RepID=A0A5N6L666_9ROSI|nr:hypothetical protein FH972_027144 [Carpinus fangiana]